MQHASDSFERILTGVALSPDGRQIIAGTCNGTLKVWEAASGQQSRTLDLGLHTSMALSPDGRWIVAARAGFIERWEAATGRPISIRKGHTRWFGGRAWVKAMGWAPDSQWFVSASEDNTLKIWDAATGRELRTLEGHRIGVRAVAVAPDGQWIVSGQWQSTPTNKILKVWDAVTGRDLHTLQIP